MIKTLLQLCLTTDYRNQILNSKIDAAFLQCPVSGI